MQLDVRSNQPEVWIRRLFNSAVGRLLLLRAGVVDLVLDFGQKKIEIIPLYNVLLLSKCDFGQ